MTRLRTLILAGGMALVLPGVAAAQARDWDFCEKLTLALSASHDAEPFNSLLQDMTQAKGYATLVMPGFDRCFVGRMGAEPPGVATYACRKADAPPELTARALLGKISVCLERTPDFDENGAAFFSAPPTRVTAEELTFGDKRTVVFKIEIVEGPAARPRPVAVVEDLPVEESAGEDSSDISDEGDAATDAAQPGSEPDRDDSPSLDSTLVEDPDAAGSEAAAEGEPDAGEEAPPEPSPGA